MKKDEEKSPPGIVFEDHAATGLVTIKKLLPGASPYPLPAYCAPCLGPRFKLV